MSKVICDVCGTTYPETSPQCPICNSAKNSVDQTAAGSTGEMGEGSYAYVKGGRFSKKNVRKRNKKGTTAQRTSSRKNSDKDEPSNTGLVIVVILLLLAIAAVVVYIGVHFFSSNTNDGSTNSTTTAPVDQDQEQTQDQTTQKPTDATVPCSDLKINAQIIEFVEGGETWTIVVSLTPVDTTDEICFGTSDPEVATVSSNGIVTAVGHGEAEITVSCGEIVKTCSVICSFGDPVPTDEPTEPSDSTDPTEDNVVTGEFDFAWNTIYVDDNGVGDVSLGSQGKTWTAYKSSLVIDPSLITWTSDDESVCTVEKGIVTAVGGGMTKIHASYNGVTYSCIIRCPFKTSDSSSGSSSSGNTSSGTYKISHTDVTLAVGSSFKLTLKDADGNVVDVTWTANGSNVTIDGNTITGASVGRVDVSVTYEGVTYTCIVRVTG